MIVSVETANMMFPIAVFTNTDLLTPPFNASYGATSRPLRVRRDPWTSVVLASTETHF